MHAPPVSTLYAHPRRLELPALRYCARNRADREQGNDCSRLSTIVSKTINGRILTGVAVGGLAGAAPGVSWDVPGGVRGQSGGEDQKTFEAVARKVRPLWGMVVWRNSGETGTLQRQSKAL